MLNKNMKIELDIEHENNEGLRTKTTLYSVVEEVCENGDLLIHTLVYQRKRYHLPDDTVILLRFFIGSLIYVAPVMYAERVKIGNTEYEKLRQVGEIHQNQRNDYRLSVIIPVSVERYNMNNYNQPIKGQTLNISGGGMLFAVSEEIGINEKVACTFGAGNVKTVEGTVVRSEKTDGDIYRYKISVQFTFKIQQQKQRLQKFVTEQQRLAIKQQLENEKSREGING